LLPELVVTPLTLDAQDGPRYWLGLQNFYVITRYNHSAMYAMAVWELSQAVSKARSNS
jgi:membrane-bound lytic murein transglycosylase B